MNDCGMAVRISECEFPSAPRMNVAVTKSPCDEVTCCPGRARAQCSLRTRPRQRSCRSSCHRRLPPSLCPRLGRTGRVRLGALLCQVLKLSGDGGDLELGVFVVAVCFCFGRAGERVSFGVAVAVCFCFGGTGASQLPGCVQTGYALSAFSCQQVFDRVTKSCCWVPIIKKIK